MFGVVIFLLPLVLLTIYSNLAEEKDISCMSPPCCMVELVVLFTDSNTSAVDLSSSS